MKTFIINSKDKNVLGVAVNILKKGGVIIYPTETSYGIGADATSSKSIRKIFTIKARKGKPISIIVSSLGMAKRYAKIDAVTRKLAKKFMPGPLTLVTEKKKLPQILSKKTVAWRIPRHPVALPIVKKFGKPITATSANLSGRPQLYNINDVVKTFSGHVGLIIDAGNLSRRQPSTVFDVINKKIIRAGTVKQMEILKCLKA